jgi:hypothetical protein
MFTINSWAVSTTWANVTLNITCPTDGWVWWEQIAYWTSSSPNTNWTWCASIKSFTLNGSYWTKTVYMRTQDSLGNISIDYSDTIIYSSPDSIPPAFSTWYISSWATWYKSPNYYYKWIVDIRWDVNDNIWLSTWTCMYTINWSTWNIASYTWTSRTWYCYQTGIIWSSDLFINFSIQDTTNNTWYSNTWIYIYDNFVPNILLTWLYQWAVQWWDISRDQANWVTVDSWWNSYVVWFFQWTWVFWSIQLINSGSYDPFIAKLSSTWAYMRATKWWWTGYDQSKWVAVDSWWNAYIVWFFDTTANFWSKTLISSGWNDAFIAELSSTWLYLRAAKWWGAGVDNANWIAVDGQWNSYIAWFFSATASFWSKTLISSGWNDTFIAKLSSTWLYLRAAKWWGVADDLVNWIAVDSWWNSYIAWFFSWTASFWSKILISSGWNNAFAAKLSSTWEYVRAVQWWGTGFYGQANWIAVDSWWNSCIVWKFSWPISFWSTTFTSSGISYDAFIAKLSSTWAYMRANKLWNISDDIAYWVVVDSWWNIYVAWQFKFGVNFWWEILTSDSNSYDIFITKLSSAWLYLWSTKWWDGAVDYAYWIAVDSWWNSYVVWGFWWMPVYWSTTLTTYGSFDAFITKLSYFRQDLFIINNWAISTNSVNVTLNITCPVDVWVWWEQVAFWNTANLIANWQTCITSTWHILVAWDANKTVYMKFRDALGNTQTSDVTDDIILDTTPPVAPTLTCTNFTNNITWNYAWTITCSINDTATPSARTAVAYSTNGWAGWIDNSNNLTTPALTISEWATSIIMRISDTWWWPTNSNTYVIRKDVTAPTVSQAYISSWTTWYRSPNYYYKWTVDISWSISDNIWLSTWTCQYTSDWSTWNIASYTWTSRTWYCYATVTDSRSNLYIRFRIQDTVGNTWYGTTWTYYYDILAPSLASYNRAIRWW